MENIDEAQQNNLEKNSSVEHNLDQFDTEASATNNLQHDSSVEHLLDWITTGVSASHSTVKQDDSSEISENVQTASEMPVGSSVEKGNESARDSNNDENPFSANHVSINEIVEVGDITAPVQDHCVQDSICCSELKPEQGVADRCHDAASVDTLCKPEESDGDLSTCEDSGMTDNLAPAVAVLENCTKYRVDMSNTGFGLVDRIFEPEFESHHGSRVDMLVASSDNTEFQQEESTDDHVIVEKTGIELLLEPSITDHGITTDSVVLNCKPDLHSDNSNNSKIADFWCDSEGNKVFMRDFKGGINNAELNSDSSIRVHNDIQIDSDAISEQSESVQHLIEQHSSSPEVVTKMLPTSSRDTEFSPEPCTDDHVTSEETSIKQLPEPSVADHIITGEGTESGTSVDHRCETEQITAFDPNFIESFDNRKLEKDPCMPVHDDIQEHSATTYETEQSVSIDQQAEHDSKNTEFNVGVFARSNDSEKQEEIIANYRVETIETGIEQAPKPSKTDNCITREGACPTCEPEPSQLSDSITRDNFDSRYESEGNIAVLSGIEGIYNADCGTDSMVVVHVDNQMYVENEPEKGVAVQHQLEQDSINTNIVSNILVTSFNYTKLPHEPEETSTDGCVNIENTSIKQLPEPCDIDHKVTGEDSVRMTSIGPQCESELITAVEPNFLKDLDSRELDETDSCVSVQDDIQEHTGTVFKPEQSVSTDQKIERDSSKTEIIAEVLVTSSDDIQCPPEPSADGPVTIDETFNKRNKQLPKPSDHISTDKGDGSVTLGDPWCETEPITAVEPNCVKNFNNRELETESCTSVHDHTQEPFGTTCEPEPNVSSQQQQIEHDISNTDFDSEVFARPDDSEFQKELSAIDDVENLETCIEHAPEPCSHSADDGITCEDDSEPEPKKPNTRSDITQDNVDFHCESEENIAVLSDFEAINISECRTNSKIVALDDNRIQMDTDDDYDPAQSVAIQHQIEQNKDNTAIDSSYCVSQLVTKDQGINVDSFVIEKDKFCVEQIPIIPQTGQADVYAGGLSTSSDESVIKCSQELCTDASISEVGNTGVDQRSDPSITGQCIINEDVRPSWQQKANEYGNNSGTRKSVLDLYPPTEAMPDFTDDIDSFVRETDTRLAVHYDIQKDTEAKQEQIAILQHQIEQNYRNTEIVAQVLVSSSDDTELQQEPRTIGCVSIEKTFNKQLPETCVTDHIVTEEDVVGVTLVDSQYGTKPITSVEPNSVEDLDNKELEETDSCMSVHDDTLVHMNTKFEPKQISTIQHKIEQSSSKTEFIPKAFATLSNDIEFLHEPSTCDFVSFDKTYIEQLPKPSATHITAEKDNSGRAENDTPWCGTEPITAVKPDTVEDFSSRDFGTDSSIAVHDNIQRGIDTKHEPSVTAHHPFEQDSCNSEFDAEVFVSHSNHSEFQEKPSSYEHIINVETDIKGAPVPCIVNYSITGEDARPLCEPEPNKHGSDFAKENVDSRCEFDCDITVVPDFETINKAEFETHSRTLVSDDYQIDAETEYKPKQSAAVKLQIEQDSCNTEIDSSSYCVSELITKKQGIIDDSSLATEKKYCVEHIAIIPQMGEANLDDEFMGAVSDDFESLQKPCADDSVNNETGIEEQIPLPSMTSNCIVIENVGPTCKPEAGDRRNDNSTSENIDLYCDSYMNREVLSEFTKDSSDGETNSMIAVHDIQKDTDAKNSSEQSVSVQHQSGQDIEIASDALFTSSDGTKFLQEPSTDGRLTIENAVIKQRPEPGDTDHILIATGEDYITVTSVDARCRTEPIVTVKHNFMEDIDNEELEADSCMSVHDDIREHIGTTYGHEQSVPSQKNIEQNSSSTDIVAQVLVTSSDDTEFRPLPSPDGRVNIERTFIKQLPEPNVTDHISTEEVIVSVTLVDTQCGTEQITAVKPSSVEDFDNKELVAESGMSVHDDIQELTGTTYESEVCEPEPVKQSDVTHARCESDGNMAVLLDYEGIDNAESRTNSGFAVHRDNDILMDTDDDYKPEQSVTVQHRIEQDMGNNEIDSSSCVSELIIRKDQGIDVDSLATEKNTFFIEQIAIIPQTGQADNFAGVLGTPSDDSVSECSQEPSTDNCINDVEDSRVDQLLAPSNTGQCIVPKDVKPTCGEGAYDLEEDSSTQDNTDFVGESNRTTNFLPVFMENIVSCGRETDSRIPVHSDAMKDTDTKHMDNAIVQQQLEQDSGNTEIVAKVLVTSSDDTEFRPLPSPDGCASIHETFIEQVEKPSLTLSIIAQDEGGLTSEQKVNPQCGMELNAGVEDNFAEVISCAGVQTAPCIPNRVYVQENTGTRCEPGQSVSTQHQIDQDSSNNEFDAGGFVTPSDNDSYDFTDKEGTSISYPVHSSPLHGVSLALSDFDEQQKKVIREEVGKRDSPVLSTCFDVFDDDNAVRSATDFCSKPIMDLLVETPGLSHQSSNRDIGKSPDEDGDPGLDMDEQVNELKVKYTDQKFGELLDMMSYQKADDVSEHKFIDELCMDSDDDDDDDNINDDELSACSPSREMDELFMESLGLTSDASRVESPDKQSDELLLDFIDSTCSKPQTDTNSYGKQAFIDSVKVLHSPSSIEAHKPLTDDRVSMVTHQSRSTRLTTIENWSSIPIADDVDASHNPAVDTSTTSTASCVAHSNAIRLDTQLWRMLSPQHPENQQDVSPGDLVSYRSLDPPASPDDVGVDLAQENGKSSSLSCGKTIHNSLDSQVLEANSKLTDQWFDKLTGDVNITSDAVSDTAREVFSSWSGTSSDVLRNSQSSTMFLKDSPESPEENTDSRSKLMDVTRIDFPCEASLVPQSPPSSWSSALQLENKHAESFGATRHEPTAESASDFSVKWLSGARRTTADDERNAPIAKRHKTSDAFIGGIVDKSLSALQEEALDEHCSMSPHMVALSEDDLCEDSFAFALDQPSLSSALGVVDKVDVVPCEVTMKKPHSGSPPISSSELFCGSYNSPIDKPSWSDMVLPEPRPVLLDVLAEPGPEISNERIQANVVNAPFTMKKPHSGTPPISSSELFCGSYNSPIDKPSWSDMVLPEPRPVLLDVLAEPGPEISNERIQANVVNAPFSPNYQCNEVISIKRKRHDSGDVDHSLPYHRPVKQSDESRFGTREDMSSAKHGISMKGFSYMNPHECLPSPDESIMKDLDLRTAHRSPTKKSTKACIQSVKSSVLPEILGSVDSPIGKVDKSQNSSKTWGNQKTVADEKFTVSGNFRSKVDSTGWKPAISVAGGNVAESCMKSMTGIAMLSDESEFRSRLIGLPELPPSTSLMKTFSEARAGDKKSKHAMLSGLPPVNSSVASCFFNVPNTSGGNFPGAIPYSAHSIPNPVISGSGRSSTHRVSNSPVKAFDNQMHQFLPEGCYRGQAIASTTERIVNRPQTGDCLLPMASHPPLLDNNSMEAVNLSMPNRPPVVSKKIRSSTKSEIEPRKSGRPASKTDTVDFTPLNAMMKMTDLIPGDGPRTETDQFNRKLSSQSVVSSALGGPGIGMPRMHSTPLLVDSLLEARSVHDFSTWPQSHAQNYGFFDPVREASIHSSISAQYEAWSKSMQSDNAKRQHQIPNPAESWGLSGTANTDFDSSKTSALECSSSRMKYSAAAHRKDSRPIKQHGVENNLEEQSRRKSTEKSSDLLPKRSDVKGDRDMTLKDSRHNIHSEGSKKHQAMLQTSFKQQNVLGGGSGQLDELISGSKLGEHKVNDYAAHGGTDLSVSSSQTEDVRSSIADQANLSGRLVKRQTLPTSGCNEQVQPKNGQDPLGGSLSESLTSASANIDVRSKLVNIPLENTASAGIETDKQYSTSLVSAPEDCKANMDSSKSRRTRHKPDETGTSQAANKQMENKEIQEGLGVSASQTDSSTSSSLLLKVRKDSSVSSGAGFLEAAGSVPTKVFQHDNDSLLLTSVPSKVRATSPERVHSPAPIKADVQATGYESPASAVSKTLSSGRAKTKGELKKQLLELREMRLRGEGSSRASSPAGSIMTSSPAPSQQDAFSPMSVHTDCGSSATPKPSPVAAAIDTIVTPGPQKSALEKITKPVSVSKPRYPVEYVDSPDEMSDTAWTLGDMLWAKVSGHPWWPCIVSPDPNTDIFTRQIQRKQSISNRQYHVRFYGNKNERGWVLESALIPFDAHETYSQLIERMVREQKRDRKSFAVKSNRRQAWEVAVAAAESAYMMPRQKRIHALLGDDEQLVSDVVDEKGAFDNRVAKPADHASPSSNKEKRSAKHSSKPAIVVAKSSSDDDTEEDSPLPHLHIKLPKNVSKQQVAQFAVFCQKRRSSILNEHPKATEEQIDSILQNQWSELSDETKARFIPMGSDVTHLSEIMSHAAANEGSLQLLNSMKEKREVHNVQDTSRLDEMAVFEESKIPPKKRGRKSATFDKVDNSAESKVSAEDHECVLGLEESKSNQKSVEASGGNDAMEDSVKLKKDALKKDAQATTVSMKNIMNELLSSSSENFVEWIKEVKSTSIADTGLDTRRTGNTSACALCGKHGRLISCDKAKCGKSYHLTCLQICTLPHGTWLCPWHHCIICSRSAVASCLLCTNAYCIDHLLGNIHVTAKFTVQCTRHDDSPASNEDFVNAWLQYFASVKPVVQRKRPAKTGQKRKSLNQSEIADDDDLGAEAISKDSQVPEQNYNRSGQKRKSKVENLSKRELGDEQLGRRVSERRQVSEVGSKVGNIFESASTQNNRADLDKIKPTGNTLGICRGNDSFDDVATKSSATNKQKARPRQKTASQSKPDPVVDRQTVNDELAIHHTKAKKSRVAVEKNVTRETVLKRGRKRTQQEEDAELSGFEPKRSKKGKPQNKQTQSDEDTELSDFEPKQPKKGKPGNKQTQSGNDMELSGFELKRPKKGKPRNKQTQSDEDTELSDFEPKQPKKGKPRNKQAHPDDDLELSGFEPKRPKKGKPRNEPTQSDEETELSDFEPTQLKKGKPGNKQTQSGNDMELSGFEPKRPKKGKPRNKQTQSDEDMKLCDFEPKQPKKGKPQKVRKRSTTDDDNTLIDFGSSELLSSRNRASPQHRHNVHKRTRLNEELSGVDRKSRRKKDKVSNLSDDHCDLSDLDLSEVSSYKKKKKDHKSSHDKHRDQDRSKTESFGSLSTAEALWSSMLASTTNSDSIPSSRDTRTLPASRETKVKPSGLKAFIDEPLFDADDDDDDFPQLVIDVPTI